MNQKIIGWISPHAIDRIARNDGVLSTTGFKEAISLKQGHPTDVPLMVAGASFQTRVGNWMDTCFSEDICKDMRERGDRLLEEVLEYLQAHSYDPTRVATLVDYVYGRPVGEPKQELGGVMVTLAAHSRAAGLDMDDCGEVELARIWEKMDVIREKQAAKRDIHGPLP